MNYQKYNQNKNKISKINKVKLFKIKQLNKKRKSFNKK